MSPLSLDLILDHTPGHRKPWRIRRSQETRALRRFKDRQVAKMFGERKAREMGGKLIVEQTSRALKIKVNTAAIADAARVILARQEFPADWPSFAWDGHELKDLRK